MGGWDYVLGKLPWRIVATVLPNPTSPTQESGYYIKPAILAETFETFSAAQCLMLA